MTVTKSSLQNKVILITFSFSNNYITYTFYLFNN